MTSTPPATRRTRPLYWSIRREIWENRAVYLAQAAVSGLILLAFLIGSFRLPATVLKAAAPGGEKAVQSLDLPYALAAVAGIAIAFVVAVFYCLGALHGERRDRSLLFWKSLPVSDLTTVLSKLAVPVVVQPLAVLGVAVGTHLIMLLWSTMILLLNGVDPSLLWTRLHLPLIWVMLPYGLLVNAIWSLPVYAWLMLVSAWAKRMTFVWAVAPPLGLCLFELLAFRTRHLFGWLDSRVLGGFAEAFSLGGKGQAPIRSLADVDPVRILANPGLWTGLAVAAACLAGCVWLRRRSDPI